MKRMSRYSRASRVLVLLLCALLLAGMLPSYGALGASKRTSKGGAKNDGDKKGSLTVYLKTDVSKLPNNGADVEVTSAKEPSALQKVADKLAGEILKGEFTGRKLSKFNKKGIATIDGLEQGVYLGVWTGKPAGFDANSFFITIPTLNADKTGLLYDIKVNDKDTYTGDLTVSKAVVSPYTADHSKKYSFTITLKQGGKVLDQDYHR